jgi:Fibronectin type III-like domain
MEISESRPPSEIWAAGSPLSHRHRTVTIALDARSFSYWNSAEQNWVVAPGCDTIMVGTSSRALPLRARVAQGGAACGR